MSWAVILDFDGTITTHDVADSILRRYGGIPERDIRASYRPGVITEDWVRERFLRVRCRPEDLEGFVLRTVRARRGFSGFIRWCRERKVPVEIVSGGLDLYLDLLLERWRLEDLPRWRARARWTGRGISVRYPFLKGRTLECFKLSRVRAHQRRGRKVLFAGDGASDIPAARAADLSFARGRLLRHCRKEGTAVRVLSSFDALRRRLEEGSCSRP